MNFWGHVEVLRWVLIRCLVVVFGLAVAVFCLKDFVFDGIILAPSRADFVTYRLMSRLGELTGMSIMGPQDLYVGTREHNYLIRSGLARCVVKYISACSFLTGRDDLGV